MEVSHACCNVREWRIRHTTPVDWYDNGISPYGVYDLCGNVWEWCATERGFGVREVRGGSFLTSLHRVAPRSCHTLPVDTRREDVGFRCVTPLETMLALLSV
jgi:formylglycine-generating enzyme required for sulfatase activity